MMERLRDRVSGAAEAVTYRAVQFGLENPVAFAFLLIGGIVLLVFLALTVVSGVWRYAVWAAVAYLAFRLLSSGALQGAIEIMRTEPRRYVWLGVVLVVTGLAIPFVVHPQTYVDTHLTLSYKLTSGKGWFGFVLAEVDVNSVSADVKVVRAYDGFPGLHATEGVPEFKTEPGDGWWVCLHEATDFQQYDQYCWRVPGVSVFVQAISGKEQSAGFNLYNLPIHSDKGYFVVTLYRDRVPMWTDNFAYVVAAVSG